MLALPGPRDAVLIVAAHPDDETAGLGGALAGLLQPAERVSVLFLTDGTPLDPRYFARDRPWTPAAYRAARKHEARAALAILGIDERRLTFSAIPDLELAARLDDGLALLEAVAGKLRPAAIFVPAYEGGHPDHDAANFLVAQLIQRIGARELPPTAWEYPLYTARDGTVLHCCFPEPCDANNVVLGPRQVEQKRRAIAAYESQRETLANFPVDSECFRALPIHDYLRPAVRGPAVYELWGWPMRASQISQQFDAFVRERRARRA